MPKVSIIVPFFNARKTLGALLKDLSDQSFCEWECILVNDGSLDEESCEALDESTRLDDRIKIVYQRNRGPSAARNRGIRSSRSELITFVDADDRISPSHLAVMYDVYKRDSSDLVIVNNDVVVDGKRSGFGDRKNVKSFYNISCSEKCFCELDDLCSVVWGRLFRAEIIRSNDILFTEMIHVGEDTLFMYTFLQKANKISVLLDAITYHYTLSDNSLMRSANSQRRYFFDRFQMFKTWSVTTPTRKNLYKYTYSLFLQSILSGLKTSRAVRFFEKGKMIASMPFIRIGYLSHSTRKVRLLAFGLNCLIAILTPLNLFLNGSHQK